ncbi:hypothetical protein LAZ40_02260 [Cereibacter sphaeroides]|uniref:hypothetical protein n=1 Tax=Cereibacter sphaeroides TaxID=1063 RepID=UPI001F1CAF75|nr:hypothetical protein [Cereibacter sphaeroides]MCE6957881.1 hypothetical protein [Cereibacter sphaeroides]MCE6971850.1 hypothetical protein [Cereibacter sphaeroides]
MTTRFGDQRQVDQFQRHRDDREICWIFPVSWLSTAERHDDELHVRLEEGGHWSALAECDQCVKRDLDEEEIRRFLDETGLERFAPKALLEPTDPSPGP